MEQNKKRGKKNNKGFSLVELLIVMAIMAILVGTVAPQVVKYVEKARETKDLQVLDTVFTAAQTAIATSDKISSDFNGKFDGTSGFLSSFSEAGDLLSEDMNTSSKIIAKCQSKKATGDVYVTYDAATGFLAVYIASTQANVSSASSVDDFETAVNSAVSTTGLGPVTNQ